MGSKDDKFSVVDENLKVYGIECLRIGDASIFPNIISGHTHAPCIFFLTFFRFNGGREVK
jgi:choline dehydrogenase-like flavoprotein